MKILWLSWKDHAHPLAGGAEVVLRELNRRLIRDGHDVTVLTAKYQGASEAATLEDVTVYRTGRNRYLHSFQALAYYLRRLRGKFDAVIEVVNTAPYFSPLFSGSTPVYLFYHQLARDIWFYETSFPLNRFGFHVLEPLANRVLARSGRRVITVSESTRQDLTRFGFDPTAINVISEGTEVKPVTHLGSVKKFSQPTILSLGAIRPMKRTLDQIKAFELIKPSYPDMRLIIAGDNSGSYGRGVLAYCQASPFATDIQCLGRVSTDEKLSLMQRAHAITVTSIKEGWGLVVTEAASQGTPAVVYDVDGLRDSVRHGETGLITSAHPEALAAGLGRLMGDPVFYENVRNTAWDWSRNITFDKAYQDFKEVVFA